MLEVVVDASEEMGVAPEWLEDIDLAAKEEVEKGYSTPLLGLEEPAEAESSMKYEFVHVVDVVVVAS